MSASWSPARDAVVVLHRELDRSHALEVGRVERRPRAGRHLGRDARDTRDGVDRMTEQVAVVQAVAAAERARGFAELGVDERVDDHRRPALRAVQRQLEVVDRLDSRVADLVELLVRKLRLERVDEADRRLARRVGDDVELDLLRRHERQRNASGAAAARPCDLARLRPTKSRSRHSSVTDMCAVRG